MRRYGYVGKKDLCRGEWFACVRGCVYFCVGSGGRLKKNFGDEGKFCMGDFSRAYYVSGWLDGTTGHSALLIESNKMSSRLPNIYKRDWSIYYSKKNSNIAVMFFIVR